MSRLSRKNRPYSDYKIKSSSGILDLFDNFFKKIYRIDDNEYDFIAGEATPDELDILTKDPSINPVSFTEKREILITLDNLLNRYERPRQK